MQVERRPERLAGRVRVASGHRRSPAGDRRGDALHIAHLGVGVEHVHVAAAAHEVGGAVEHAPDRRDGDLQLLRRRRLVVGRPQLLVQALPVHAGADLDGEHPQHGARPRPQRLDVDGLAGDGHPEPAEALDRQLW